MDKYSGESKESSGMMRQIAHLFEMFKCSLDVLGPVLKGLKE